jgi:C4-dicarboxylate-binding protein DctP
VTSVDFLDSLEPEVRDQFTTILNEVTTARNAEAFAVNEAAKQSILDAGGTILTLTPEQRTAWVETMMPVWAQFVEDVGQENIDAAQAINDSL